MPKTKDLDLFARQLANWTEQIIENGRTPFRRVDLFCPLQTAQGQCEPPLILWINRRSLIAGGLIFLPDEKLPDPHYTKEAAAAEALGLRHFVCWEERRVQIFETGARGNQVVATHALDHKDDLFFFQRLLNELLEQLKLFSVTGRVDAASLSPFYLINLFNETLQRAEPALLEHCRTTEGPKYEIRSGEQIASDWNRLTLLRLLSLLHWQPAGENLSMDDLQTGWQELLTQLPEPLASLTQHLYPLATHELPQEANVAFHHLLLRLKQLDWQSGSLKSQTVLRTLLAHWYEREPTTSGHNMNNRRLVHAPWLAPECRHETSNSAALLTANAILRTLDEATHPLQQWGDSFCFHLPFGEHRIEAFFAETSRPETSLRRALAGHLRTSWPNRHLSLPGNLPYWVFEAAHLLGLCPDGAEIRLDLPGKWLLLLDNSFFCELLFSHFSITDLWVLPHNTQRLMLQRHSHQVLTRCHLADGTERCLELSPAPLAATRELFYTLELPTEIYDLYQHQQLRILTEVLAHDIKPSALALYARTRLGQDLLKLRASKPRPETDGDIANTGILVGWLVPEPELAHELYQQVAPESSTAVVELCLTKILNLAPHFSLNLPQSAPPPVQSTETATRVERNLPQELLKQLEIEGIPSFPKTYLYRYATGSLKLYRFAPPLQVAQELLGEYELVDAKGQTLNVSGEETQEALLLASSLGLSEIEIPEDRQQTAAILESYRADLQSLKDRVEHLCYSHTGQTAAAQRLLKKIWQQLPLPPRKQLSD
jgi:hypothetical protein